MRELLQESGVGVEGVEVVKVRSFIDFGTWEALEVFRG